jgi:hypothetical protein
MSGAPPRDPVAVGRLGQNRAMGPESVSNGSHSGLYRDVITGPDELVRLSNRTNKPNALLGNSFFPGRSRASAKGTTIATSSPALTSSSAIQIERQNPMPGCGNTFFQEGPQLPVQIGLTRKPGCWASLLPTPTITLRKGTVEEFFVVGLRRVARYYAL